MVSAVDVSEVALQVAQKNAVTHKVSVTFRCLDILKEVPAGKFDLIISNPPYISQQEKNLMQKNVLDYEPHLALFADDTLVFYKRIAAIAPQLLNSGGAIFMELNEHFAPAIKVIFEQQHFICELKLDMQGKQRMLCAK